MSSFVFATQPITGHVVPAVPIVRALVERGHDVRWYVGKKFRGRAEEAGAEFVPYQRAYDYDGDDLNNAFPGRGDLKALKQITFDFLHLFVEQIEPQHRDLEAALAARPADVLVGDPSVVATFTVNERGGPPNAVYNITVLQLSGGDIAPFGLGLMPTGSPLGRLRNRALEWLAPNVIFKKVSDEAGRQCRLVGVAPRKFQVLFSPYVHLQPTAEAFEYRRPDLPPQIHFIGALLPDAPTDFVPPTWWPEVVAKDRPVVLVTQGTVATNADELVAPALRGLADDDVLVIAAGVADPAVAAGAPANARVEGFVPFKPLMPMVDVFVTNGGFGGVQFALSNGVPIVAAGKTEDKPEIGNRITYSGCGINLKTATPSPRQVRDAVRTILGDPTYRDNARRIQAELSSKDAPAVAADLLERLAETKAPVLRS